MYKRADLLGISVYDLIHNYIFIFDKEFSFCGVALQEDIDKYIITHDKYSDSITLLDLSAFANNLRLLNYDALEKILEN